MRVRNLNNTSSKSCSCGSWTNHWENHAGARNWPQKCGAYGCPNPPQVGAHVKHVGSDDPRHYIVMLCRPCNNRFGQVIELESYVTPAWANIRETCTPGFSW